MKNKIIAYALHFASFLLEGGVEPRRIILFGSAVSGEFDNESDIDVFVDTNEPDEKKVRSALKVFDITFGEKWKMKGVRNPISLKVGDLEKWKGLKRSMQSQGVIIYGKYIEPPENIKPYIMFRLDFGRMARARKVGLWRELYGYVQKVGGKRYEARGFIKNIGGQKLEKGIVLMPAGKSQEFKKFLNKNGVGFKLNEIWSDDL